MDIRVLIVDDHAIVRSGLSAILAGQADIKVVGEAADGHAAVRMVRELTPDVVLLDVTMPLLNGVDATRAILEANPQVRIIVLSMHQTQQLIRDALTAGAAAFLPKNSDPEELLLAIHAVNEGRGYLGSKVARSVMTGYVEQGAPPQGSVFATLSGKEREVLQLLAEGKSNKEIANLLHISARTVEAHRAQVMDKLGIHSLAGLTRYAIKEGISPLDL